MSGVETGGYGYQNDEEAVSKGVSGSFGLNAGAARLNKWDYITNGGAGGAAGEALDIEFLIDGRPRGYRVFPITKAFLPNNGGETTDPTSQAMKDAFKDQNAVLTHILSKFVDKDTLISALSVPGLTFQRYCEITKGLIGAAGDPRQVPLDIFLQYQWQITGENSQTFLEIPRKMKHGIWLGRAVTPLADAEGNNAEWKAVLKNNPADNDPKALTYVDGAGNEHPFTRNGWFVKSNFANQQKETQSAGAGAMAPTPTAASNLPQATPGAAVGGFGAPAATPAATPAPNAAPAQTPPPAASGW